MQLILSPCRAPAAGTVAVTVTSATFFAPPYSAAPLVPVGLPISCMAVARQRMVGRNPLPSPVPLSPTTIPSPCSVFSSCPLTRQMFLNSVRPSDGEWRIPNPTIIAATARRRMSPVGIGNFLVGFLPPGVAAGAKHTNH